MYLACPFRESSTVRPPIIVITGLHCLASNVNSHVQYLLFLIQIYCSQSYCFI